MPFANRYKPEIQNTIGLFSQVWPFSVDTNHDETFLSFCNRVKHKLISMSLKTEIGFTQIAFL